MRYEPPSKPKDDIYWVSRPIFTIIYMSLGFEAPGVRILLLIVQHGPNKTISHRSTIKVKRAFEVI